MEVGRDIEEKEEKKTNSIFQPLGYVYILTMSRILYMCTYNVQCTYLE